MKRYFLIYILLTGYPVSLFSMLPSLPAGHNPYAARLTSPANSLSAIVTYGEPEQAPELRAEQPVELSRAPKSRKTCAICLGQLYNKAELVVQLPCSRKHAFHYSCIARAHDEPGNRTCPLCRAELFERITSPQNIEAITEQLEQEKTVRRNLESDVFFKNFRIQKLVRKNENLTHQNSALLEEITRLQYPGEPEEYSVAQHPPRPGKRKNRTHSRKNKRRRRRYSHPHNQQEGQELVGNLN